MTKPPVNVNADLTEAATHATKKAGEVVDDVRALVKAVFARIAEPWGWGSDAIAELRRRHLGTMAAKN